MTTQDQECRAVTSDTSKMDGFVAALRGKVERCGKPATRMSPSGPRCEECSAREIEATLAGKTMLGIMLEDALRARGKDAARKHLWSKYRPIQ